MHSRARRDRFARGADLAGLEPYCRFAHACTIFRCDAETTTFATANPLLRRTRRPLAMRGLGVPRIFGRRVPRETQKVIFPTTIAAPNTNKIPARHEDFLPLERADH